jgi:hypothetical protein
LLAVLITLRIILITTASSTITIVYFHWRWLLHTRMVGSSGRGRLLSWNREHSMSMSVGQPTHLLSPYVCCYHNYQTLQLQSWQLPTPAVAAETLHLDHFTAAATCSRSGLVIWFLVWWRPAYRHGVCFQTAKNGAHGSAPFSCKGGRCTPPPAPST